ncbi:FAD-dependent oxidoreductase [Aeromicrobium sp. CFBP 8757]|uniref:NAD(P)/FAD-dependent oxidoreductase n=1 Tax=Aeromicrobium sp. CFBP 8757 TaxID=2775288 RepID=UPI00177DA01F|nr:NAD(P)/FAD-dependent oxidoreductase [Aeromicrobium sp. CFBP 8757]MBD8607528.1 FAD-dependent oxidoreductase [Aeromicrobium sp. CFBP 8757]
MSETTASVLKRPHVVVVGGGFGGIAAVRKLKRADVDVTLIDRHNYNTFNPLLYQVATASLNPGDITWFLRAIRAKQSNVRFLKGTVTSMDHASKTLHLDGGLDVKYDSLVIAVGVTANFFGIPGAAEHSMPLYRRSQALAVRDRMFANLEDAAINGQDRDLRIIVVGGGATGVETAGAFAELRNNDMPTTYPELDTKRVHITLVEMLPHVLGPFHPSLRDYAKKSLEKRDVELRLETAVKEVRPDGVLVEHDGEQEFLPSSMVVWASGVTAHDTVKEWAVPQGRGGRIETDEHLRVKGVEDVYAIGDVSVSPEEPLPQLAQPAIQGGKHVAKVIAAELKGKTLPKPFKYKDKGTMATIGRNSAIAEIKFLPRLKGFPAWIIWVALHIATLLGNRNRFATLINLTAKYLLGGTHNAIVGETPPIVALKPVMVEARSHMKAPAKKSPVKKTAAKKAPVGAMSAKDAPGQKSTTPPTALDQ